MHSMLLLAAAIAIAPSPEPSSRIADAVAELRLTGGGKIVLGDGVHYLESPLEFTAADSNVVLRAADGARPVLSAGRRISGWRIGRDGAWRVQLAWTNRFSQLYVNGQRRERPYLPRQGYFRVHEAGFKPDTEKFNAKFVYPDGALNHYWPDLDQVELRVFHNWSNTRMRIKEIDPVKHVVTLAGLSSKGCSDNAFTSRFWFRAENVRAAFGEPGDWYLTPEHELWYMPLPGETPEDTEVVASFCDRVVKIDGAARIGFVGIAFSHADESIAGNGRYYGQAGFFLPGAVHAVNARGIRFKDCAFVHVGSFGLVFAENCHDCKATGCEFYDLGAGGVRIGNGSFAKDHAPDASTCTIEDCHLAHGGRVDPVAAAIWIGNASSNRVSNCTIEDFYYSGISCGWEWGLSNRRSHHNVLENCHVFDIGQGVLSDLGGIYTLAQQPGTVVRGNYVHDVTRSIYMAAGIYFDECSSFIVASNNYVTAVQDECMFLNGPRSNVVVRNVFRASMKGVNAVSVGVRPLTLPSRITDNVYELAAPGTRFSSTVPRSGGWIVTNNVSSAAPPPPTHVGKLSPDKYYAALPPVPKVFSAGLGPEFPERPFSESFESTETGQICTNLPPWPKDAKHTFVTDEAAYEGRKSYKMVDGMKPEFAPHLNKTVNRSGGKVRVSFALRAEPGSVPIMQLRQDPYRDVPQGPALRVDGEGTVYTTRGKPLMRIEHGKWHVLAVEFALGKDRGQAVYTVEVTGPDGKKSVFPDNPYDELFERMTWLGFISSGKKDSAYYLDDIRVSDPQEVSAVGATVPVEVDFGKTIGSVRPALHSSGFGPQICSCPSQVVEEVKSMGFKASRTHDWALINPNQRVCDYFHIFPLMHLDAKDPENYVFGPTDYLLKRTLEELGNDVFFRLGTSIEHSGKKVHFNAAIPEDFDKVAEIFAGTVRHYNRGWANGHEWGIKYWEIWNEPDGNHNMWCLPEGDEEHEKSPENDAKRAKRRVLFVKFFVTCLKRLKGEFPDVKVGGPAMCWMDREYFRALLSACREAGVAPDFISWHHYAEDTMVIADAIRTGRAICDEFGFFDCELVIDEWHYFSFSDYDWGDLRSPDPEKMRICWEGPRSHNGIDSSCFNLAVLSRMQTSVLDRGFYYGCPNTGNWGYKDTFQRKYKVYYGLKMFGDLMKEAGELCATKVPPADGGPAVTALATRSGDGRRKSLLLVDYRTRASAYRVKISGVGENARVRAYVHDMNHDFEAVEVCYSDGYLTLNKPDLESAAFLVTFE